MKLSKSIFTGERMNYRRIHLQLIEDKWCAVERSAYYFASLFKTACPDTALCDGQGNRFVAICAVPCFELREPVVGADLSITRVDQGHIVIRLGRRMGGFKRWRTLQAAAPIQ